MVETRTKAQVVAAFLGEMGYSINLDGYRIENTDLNDGRIEFVKRNPSNCNCYQNQTRPASLSFHRYPYTREQQIDIFTRNTIELDNNGKERSSNVCEYTLETTRHTRVSEYQTVEGKEFPVKVAVEKEEKVSSAPVSCKINQRMAMVSEITGKPPVELSAEAFKIVMAAVGEKTDPTFFKDNEVVIKVLREKLAAAKE